METENRVVVLIDMDCFYCQVEEKLNPELKGQPIAVVQYNPWKGGGIIAVNYVARAMGVTRHMRGDEAKEKCPEIQLPSVPCLRGKADISKYRDAGKEVARVLQKFTPLLERASIDEAYLDITTAVQQRLNTLNVNAITTETIPNTYALGYDSIEEFISDVHSYGSDSIEFDYENAKRLLVGGVVVSEIRAAVYEETGYRCSAGIAHNKILAKLVCGMNKPNKQTVLPKHSINILYKTLSLKKVKHLGGKFGDTVCEILRIKTMGDLQKFTEKDLQARFDEKNGSWLYNIARGIDLEPVQARFNPKSIGCCKQLRGKSTLYDLESLKKWLNDLGDEIEDRLEKDALENNRTPKQMVTSFSAQGADGRDSSSSRSYNFTADDELCGELFSSKALELILDSLEGVKPVEGENNRKLKAPIKFLGISVGKFEDHSDSKKTRKIVDYFGAGPSNVNKTKDNNQDLTKNLSNYKSNNKKSEGKDFIMQKFLQSDKNNVTVNKEDIKETTEQNEEKRQVIETPLSKQESFFTKLLNKGQKVDPKVAALRNTPELNTLRPTTPVCDIVECGDDSNDTEYSGSTINMEINKSIAMFEEDPEDITRVSNMRELLNSTVLEDKSDQEIPEESNNDELIIEKQTEIRNKSPQTIETFECSDCRKTLPIKLYETHADYHLALKLREEDRQRVRDEYKEKTKPKKSNEDKRKKPTEATKKSKPEDQKNDTIASVKNFFVKVDATIPTEVCSECRKRIPVEKFQEHSDFHEAQKLSRQLNNKASTATSYFTGNSVKRKRKSISPIKKPKLPCTSKSIESFFR